MTNIIETDRLYVRQFSCADFKDLCDLFSDDETMRFIGPRRPMTSVETREWLEHQLDLQSGSITRYAIALKEGNELIGVCGVQRINDILDFGYYFRKRYWNQGFAFEAGKYVLAHLIKNKNFHDFNVFVAKENVSSQKLLLKLGFEFGALTEKDGENGYFCRMS